MILNSGYLSTKTMFFMKFSVEPLVHDFFKKLTTLHLIAKMKDSELDNFSF